MVILILGLIIFLGVHSVRILAPGIRSAAVARMGEGPYKGLYALASLVGFIAIVWGYGLARQDPVPVWPSPETARHLAVGLNLIAFLILGFFFVRASPLKARVGHPMLIATIVWAVAHLIANGFLHDIVLFGAFLVWAVSDLGRVLGEERASGLVRASGPPMNDAIALGAGFLLYVAILLFLHRWLVGVSPLP